MAPKQATLGKWMGKNGSKPEPRQSKLNFGTKPAPKKETKVKDEEGEEEGDAQESKQGAVSPASAKENKDPESAGKKRPHDEVDKEDTEIDEKNVKVEKSDDDAAPSAPKRALTARNTRRARNTVMDDDEDEAMEDSPALETKVKANQASNTKTKTKTKKSSPSPSPPIKEKGGQDSATESTASDVEDDSDAVSEAEDAVVAEDKSKPTKGKSKSKAKAKSAKGALSEVQTTLTSKETKHPYPDWKAGDAVPYAALCKTFSLVELTTKRLEIMAHCSLFLRQVMRLTPDDLLPTVLLMINKLAPDYAGIELGIGESLIMKAIGETTGRTLQIIKQDQKEIGDLGLVAVKSRSTQPTMFKPKPLTVRGVHKGLMGIATTTGNGAQGRKVDGIKKLLSSADASSTGKVDITKDKGGPSEAKYLVRFLEGKLRLGLAERTVLVSLAQAAVNHEAAQKDQVASATDVEQAEAMLKTVYSYDVIIPAMVQHGIMQLREHCKLKPGVPLKPMLAKPTKAITEVLDRFENQTFTCEYKYDGERAQIHYVASSADEELSQSLPGATKEAAGGVANIFSRNSEDLSKKYPDILAKLHTWVGSGTESFVLDCETVAWDVEEKKVLPFQQLMTRKKKDVKIEDVKVKVCVFAFDLLYLNGEALVEKPLRERRELLAKAFTPVEGEFSMATHMNGQELEQIQEFLDESVKASCEGLMVKMLDGSESGYEPSKRSRNWLKIKKDYLSGVGDSLDLVVVGAYYGKGKRTSVYGAFLLACYNPSTDSYETICNIGTGFSEAVLEELHAALSAIVIDRPKPFYAHSSGNQHQPDVWFEPRFVWEVKTADLTLSPRYKAGCREGVDPAAPPAGDYGDDNGSKGISLRFPRFIKVRDDKKPDEATSSRQVAEMYRKQEAVTKNKGPSVDDDFEY